MFKNPTLDYSKTEAIINSIFLFLLSIHFFINCILFFLANGNTKLSLKNNICSTDGNEDNHENN